MDRIPPLSKTGSTLRGIAKSTIGCRSRTRTRTHARTHTRAHTHTHARAHDSPTTQNDGCSGGFIASAGMLPFPPPACCLPGLPLPPPQDHTAVAPNHSLARRPPLLLSTFSVRPAPSSAHPGAGRPPRRPGARRPPPGRRFRRSRGGHSQSRSSSVSPLHHPSSGHRHLPPPLSTPNPTPPTQRRPATRTHSALRAHPPTRLAAPATPPTPFVSAS